MWSIFPVSQWSFVVLMCSVVALQFNEIVDVPYMDEPFHYNQTVEYCHGNFHQWNEKITTFPGLYLCALGYAFVLYCLSFGLLNFALLCTNLSILRSMNLFFGFGTLFLLQRIIGMIHPKLAIFKENFHLQ